ncbi:MAG: S-layer homology domain-containing protein [Eubacteriales bacterium]
MYKKILSWVLTIAIIFTMIGGASISGMAIEFSDIGNHWARDNINQWVEKGLINGYGDGTFKPNGYITRGEFITLVNNVINSAEEIDINFDDVTEEEWYYRELQKAIFLGYIKGYEDNTFRANENISRQEVAVILQKIVQLDPSEENTLGSFSDSSDIPEWSREAIQLAVQKGYLSGYEDNSLKAANYITRAESVKVLSNLFGEVYNEAGVYGPEEGLLEVERNVTVSIENVTLQNMIIYGDLYLAEGIGEGEVTLDNVEVVGDTIVKGGGENSIIIKNSSLENLIIIKKDGKVRILAMGNTNIKNTKLQSSGKLQGEERDNFNRVEIIKVSPGEAVELEGHFNKVDVSTLVDIEVSGKSRIEEIKINKEIEGVLVKVSPYSIINKLVANSELAVDNRGVITEALGEFADSSTYENRLPVNLKPKTSSSPSTPAAPKYTLSLTVTPAGFGTASGGGSYEEGKNITITASANEGYEFVEWKKGGVQITTDSSFVYTMTAENITLTAEFIEKEFNGGSGTSTDPYQVANAVQLNNVRNYLSASFIQTADIDLGDYVTEGGIFYNAGEGWEPIGYNYNKFQGFYNGNNKTISGLTISRPTEDFIGLFGMIDGASIENLDLNNVDVEGKASVGSVVGNNNLGTIDNIIVSGSVRGNANKIGGLVGQNYNDTTHNINSKINDCHANVVVSSTASQVGGLVGSANKGLVYDSSAHGAVSGVSYIGGLVGDNGYGSQISQSYFTGSVDGNYNVGGLVGRQEYAYGKYISDSYSTGTVNGTDKVGGLVGSLENESHIRRSYATGSVNGNSNVGGLVGSITDGPLPSKIEKSYWDKESTNQTSSAGSTSEFGKTTLDMKNQSTYVDWDFPNTWTINTIDNSGYPALAWQGFNHESDFNGGSGTQADPYQVANAEQLNNVRDYLDAYFIQTADIDLNDYVTEGGIFYNEGKGWAPIGSSYSSPFDGSYDGNGFTISNLYINRSPGTYIGLFGYTSSDSNLKNISLDSIDILGVTYTGGLIGYNNGSVSSCSAIGIVEGTSSTTGLLAGLNKGTVNNCSVSGEVYGINDVGGFVGSNENNGVISSSYAEVIVDASGYRGGGFAGYNDSGSQINDCYSLGDVNGSTNVGGFVGRNSGSISKSFSTGNATASTADQQTFAGGLVGYNDGGISNCYALGNVSGYSYVGGLIGSTSSNISNSYSIGSVTATETYGGLVGYKAVSSTVTSSYWDTITSGLVTSSGGTGYVTSAMIKSTNSVPIYEGWDFDTIWNIDTGTSYPYLRNNEQQPHPVPIG